mmetsp:Transcript_48439/g.109991  ORF Transcript_48439/g.109991 Transcript_48439/m.109991 type:complete len:351 (-) Transcript_48439:59-1111(-)
MSTSAPAGGIGIYSCMGVMLISGSANTLLMKFMAGGAMAPTGPGGVMSGFSHPFFQTLLMCLGELLCLGVFLQSRLPSKVEQKFPSYIFLVPSICDWTATTLVNVAYVFIPASIIQMTRGSMVIFTCLFSVVFLKRRLHAFHYTGVGMVALGITLVALCAVLYPSTGGSEAATRSATIGIALCVGAQVFQASMLVIEEKFLKQYHVPPLQAVGLEGVFGVGIGLFVLSLVNVTGVESTPAAMYQMTHSTPIMVAAVASIISIAFFNWSGITVTSQASCVARSTIDCSRTIIIWAVELALMWNVFHWLQLVGFLVLAFGTLLYNQVIEFPSVFAYPQVEEEKALTEEVETA